MTAMVEALFFGLVCKEEGEGARYTSSSPSLRSGSRYWLLTLTRSLDLPTNVTSPSSLVARYWPVFLCRNQCPNLRPNGFYEIFSRIFIIKKRKYRHFMDNLQRKFHCVRTCTNP